METVPMIEGVIPVHLLSVCEEILRNSRGFGPLKFLFNSYQFTPGKYGAPHLYQDRDSLLVPGDLLGGTAMISYFEKAKEAKLDVVLNSVARCFESAGIHQQRHIPMIDFNVPHGDALGYRPDAEHLQTLGLNLDHFRYFNSGRSFHGYGTSLLKYEEWVAFMGKLLLLNNEDCAHELIDSRWVGHRLIKGTGALRWTQNNEKYLTIPTWIPNPFGSQF